MGSVREQSVDGNEVNADVEALIQRFEEGSTASKEASTFAEQVLNSLTTDDSAECPICFDAMDRPVLIPACMHQWFVHASISQGVRTDTLA